MIRIATLQCYFWHDYYNFDTARSLLAWLQLQHCNVTSDVMIRIATLQCYFWHDYYFWHHDDNCDNLWNDDYSCDTAMLHLTWWLQLWHCNVTSDIILQLQHCNVTSKSSVSIEAWDFSDQISAEDPRGILAQPYHSWRTASPDSFHIPGLNDQKAKIEVGRTCVSNAFRCFTQDGLTLKSRWKM